MRSFAVQANVFLVKAGSSQRRVGADSLVRRTQMSCGRDTGLRAPTARTPGPRCCGGQTAAPRGPVLGGAAVKPLGIAELALNEPKHMLDSRAHLAEPVIAG